MAGIDLGNLFKLEKQRNTVHQEVIATYTIFEAEGKKYFQIDTYGKNGRDMPEKISQSIQFDDNSAKYFVNLLVHTFNIK